MDDMPTRLAEQVACVNDVFWFFGRIAVVSLYLAAVLGPEWWV